MLYLAEVKKQVKGFIGGFKTELKLLACQHNDQSWSPVPGEEIIVCEDLFQQLGESTLMMVNLGTNRQLQSKPELAGPELIRQLQKLSRLMEKSKDQQEEIEQWKLSLTAQSEELNRRRLEMESQLEEIEQMQQEFEYLERQRRELEESWENLRQEQERLQKGQRLFGFAADIPPEQAAKLQAFIGRFCSTDNETDSLWKEQADALEKVQQQQGILDIYWHRLEEQRAQLEQRQREVEQRSETLNNRRQELSSANASLEQAKIDLQIQHKVLDTKQELLGRIKRESETLETLQITMVRLSSDSGEILPEHRVDLNALETMPLGELESIVKHLQEDLDKLVHFVNDQEEELTLQSQTVEELEVKLASANDYDRLAVEGELAYEKERKNMLDETLVGQRRTLRERQAVLLQHWRVLRRRQGIVEPEEGSKLNLDPLLLQLEEQQQHIQGERQRLEQEIEHLQQSLHQIQEIISHQSSEQEAKTRDLKEQEQQWQKDQAEIVELRIRVDLYGELLHPLQNQLNEIRQKLEKLGEWFSPLQSSSAGEQEVFFP